MSGTLSYWQATLPAHLRGLATPPPGHIHCDVAVVGAGYVGAYAALRLADAGARVAVLDAVAPVHGASSRSAGMALTGLAGPYTESIAALGRHTARAAWQLTVRNRHLLLQLVDRFAIPLVEHRGSLVLAGSDEEAEALRASEPFLREDGFHATFHPTDPLHRGFLGALEYPDDLGIHPALTTAAILAGSRAPVYAPARVHGWEEHPTGVRAWGADFVVHAQQLVLATNAFSGRLAPALARLIRPIRGQVLVTAPLGRRVCSTLAYADRGYQYFRQLPDGRLLLGGCRLPHAQQEVGLEDAATPDVQECLERYLARVFPEAAGLPIEYRWSGPMAFSPDGLPLVGRLSPRVCYAVGFTGHGFSLGLATVERLLDLLRHHQSPGLLSAERLTPAPASAR